MKSFYSFLLAFLLFSLQILPLAQAQTREISCKVVGISDGDTLTCLQDRKPLKVRLLHIDAPESGQPDGKNAKQALAALAFKKQVQLHATGYDKYGRLLAEVYEGSQNINLTLVQQGWAWAYVQTKPLYKEAELIAKNKRIGLWQNPYPVSPSEWRKLKRTNVEQQAQTITDNSTLAACKAKLSCAKFQDFNAAYRYFKQCNAQYMDGNGDGIPCNRLYRKMQAEQSK